MFCLINTLILSLALLLVLFNISDDKVQDLIFFCSKFNYCTIRLFINSYFIDTNNIISFKFYLTHHKSDYCNFQYFLMLKFSILASND